MGCRWRDIATDLQVAKPTIYYYFRNKDEIVRELMAMAVTAFHGRDRSSRRLSGRTDLELVFNPFELSDSALRPRDQRRVGRVAIPDLPLNQLPPEMHAVIMTALGAARYRVRRTRDCAGIDDGVDRVLRSRPRLQRHDQWASRRSTILQMELHRGTAETLADMIVGLLAHGIQPRPAKRLAPLTLCCPDEAAACVRNVAPYLAGWPQSRVVQLKAKPAVVGKR